MASNKRKMPPTGRKLRKRQKKKRVLIVCGGKVTEPEYFGFARRELEASAVDVRYPKEGKDPVKLVKYASTLKQIAERDPDGSYEQVWAVTDADEFHNLSEADRLARKNDIKLAITNPCFEVWLIDHKKICPNSCYSTKACQREAEQCGLTMRPQGKGRSSGSAKHIVESQLVGGIDRALDNAARHNTEEKREARGSNADTTSGYAVWTDVPDVIRAMRGSA